MLATTYSLQDEEEGSEGEDVPVEESEEEEAEEGEEESVMGSEMDTESVTYGDNEKYDAQFDMEAEEQQ